MMTPILRIAVVGLAALLAQPALAQATVSPAGTWEISTQDSRYAFSLCGDGTQFCAQLTWLGNGADTPENLPYLNTMIVNEAPVIGPNQWRGTLNLYGQSADGTITMVDDTTLTLEGCFMMVICRTYRFHRYAD